MCYRYKWQFKYPHWPPTNGNNLHDFISVQQLARPSSKMCRSSVLSHASSMKHAYLTDKLSRVFRCIFLDLILILKVIAVTSTLPSAVPLLPLPP